MSLSIVFFGTPAFAVPSLDALLASQQRVVAVVTQPDRPAGRGRTERPSPVKEAARRAGLPVHAPTKLRDGAFARELAALKPDLGVVVAYGRILPLDVLAVPRLGHVNVHASLLPRHRGAAPIQFALLEGDALTGVTLMQLTEGLDEGPVLAERALAIEPGDDAGLLGERLARAGASLLAGTLPAIEAGSAIARPQDASRATYTRPIVREDARLDWNQPAEALARRVRAMAPSPGAFTPTPAGTLKAYRALVEGGAGGSPAGTLLDVRGAGPLVACGTAALRLLEVQREGGRRQPGSEYLRGAKATVGERWG